MCIIAFKELKTAVITNRMFKTMISRNPDGLGFMYRQDGRVKTLKSLGSPREKFKLFQSVRNMDFYAMHARIKTHGLINEANCHPFKILSKDDGDKIDLYVMHNGVIGKAPEHDKDMSDTWHYIEYVLKPLIKADVDLFWNNEEIQDMVSTHIGSSRLLFMRSDKVKFPVLILNSTLAGAFEKDGLWLSNANSHESYCATRHTVYPHGHNSYANTNLKKDTTILSRTDEQIRQDIEDGLMDWDDYTATTNGTRFKEKTLVNGGRIFLPDNTKDGKIVELHAKRDGAGRETFEPADNDPNAYLRDQLDMLRGMSDNTIKQFCKDDADTVADIIMVLYSKYNEKSMPYEKIIQLCRHPTEIDNIVNLLRNMTTESETRRKMQSR